MSGESPADGQGLLQRLAQRPWLVLSLLLLLAGGLRVAHWQSLRHTSCFESWRHQQMDMEFFHRWARDIAAGDLLGREPKHPLHFWHLQVAKSLFEQDPTLLSEADRARGDAGERARAQQIWDAWYGGNQLHQEPLYPYLLGGCYALAGAAAAPPLAADGPVLAYLMQICMGLLSLVLLYQVTRRMGGLVAAVAATLLAIGYAPLMHYELNLLRVTLLIFVGMALLWAFQALLAAGALQAWPRLKLFGLGVGIGLAVLAKLTLLPFGLCLIGALLWPRRQDRRRCLVFGLLLFGGMLLVLLPVLVRNAVVGAPLFGLSSVGPVTFAVTNLPEFIEYWGWAPNHMSAEVAEVMRASDGRFAAVVGETLSRHEGLGSYLLLLWRKFCMVFHHFELPNNTNLYFNELFSPALWALPFGVRLIFPLAGLGLFLSLRRRLPGLWIWLLYLALILASLVGFYTLSRFRVVWVAGLLPFAGIGVSGLWAMLRQRRYRALGLAVVPMVLLAVVMSRDLRGERGTIDLSCYTFAHRDYFHPRSVELFEARRPRAALANMERFLRIEPSEFDTWLRSAGLLSFAESRLLGLYEVAYQEYAGLLGHLGRTQQGHAAQQRAVAIRRRLNLHAAELQRSKERGEQTGR